jgi:hypothetical protein
MSDELYDLIGSHERWLDFDAISDEGSVVEFAYHMDALEAVRQAIKAWEEEHP